MKENKFVLAFVVLVFAGLYYFYKATVYYKQPATVIQHIFTQSKHGDRIEKYFVIVKYENGEVEDREVSVRQYVHLKDGESYYFTKDSFDFSISNHNKK